MAIDFSKIVDSIRVELVDVVQDFLLIAQNAIDDTTVVHQTMRRRFANRATVIRLNDDFFLKKNTTTKRNTYIT